MKVSSCSFEVNNKGTRATVMNTVVVFLLLTFNRYLPMGLLGLPIGSFNE